MAEVKPGLTAAGSLLLAAATGFPALAQERLSGNAAGPRHELLAPPGESGFSTALESMPIEATCPVEEPRHERARPISQWWQRHKARCRDRSRGYPEEFVPAPLGAAVDASASLQVARGQIARMVVRQYDFLPMSDQLKPRSKADLLKYGAWACHGAGPLFIEPTPGRPDLDIARRLAVWNELQQGPFALPPELIAIGCPDVGGLRGAEAIVIERSLIMQTSSRGTTAGGGGGGSLLGGRAQGGSGGTTGSSMSSGSTGGGGGGY